MKTRGNDLFYRNLDYYVHEIITVKVILFSYGDTYSQLSNSLSHSWHFGCYFCNRVKSPWVFFVELQTSSWGEYTMDSACWLPQFLIFYWDRTVVQYIFLWKSQVLFPFDSTFCSLLSIDHLAHEFWSYRFLLNYCVKQLIYFSLAASIFTVKVIFTCKSRVILCLQACLYGYFMSFCYLVNDLVKWFSILIDKLPVLRLNFKVLSNLKIPYHILYLVLLVIAHKFSIFLRLLYKAIKSFYIF